MLIQRDANIDNYINQPDRGLVFSKGCYYLLSHYSCGNCHDSLLLAEFSVKVKSLACGRLKLAYDFHLRVVEF